MTLPAHILEARRGLREGFAWLDRRRSLIALVRALRELLPGDGSFGDPMSTTGATPAHLLARQAWPLQAGRFGLLSELILAALQVADWAEADVRGVAAAETQSILFLDLRGFSRWALHAPKGHVASLLRQVDAVVTEAVRAQDGVIVKRLGDGLMAVFTDCEQAVTTAFAAIEAVSSISVGGYRARLRAGVHRGQPERIGRDYVGLDVNIAARLCEAAQADTVLVSGSVREQLPDHVPLADAPDIHLRGVPDGITIYLATPLGSGAKPPARVTAGRARIEL